MTISRGQMNRQLYMGGGIMDIVPREPAILGGIKKAVKKVTKGVKDIVSSDVGKAALLAAATFKLGGGQFGQIGKGPTGFSFSNLPGASLFTPETFVDTGDVAFKGSLKTSPIGKFLTSKTGGNALKLATLGAVSTFLTQTLGMTEEQAEEELARDPSTYLRQYYTNLNPNASEEEITEFVTTNTSEYSVGGRVGLEMGTSRSGLGSLRGMSGREMEDEIVIERDLNPKYDAKDFMIEEYNEENISPKILGKGFQGDEEILIIETPRGGTMMITKEDYIKNFGNKMAQGGRIGYAEGGDDEFPLGDPTAPVNPFGPKPIGPALPDKMMASNMENDKILEALFEKYIDMGLSPKDAAEAAQKEFDKMSMGKTKGRGLAALGGKMDTASDNAMQAAGIEGLPIRQNPKGVKEIDLRETGGFIQPVGIKEKEDDIPAMLSNNEFVMTADAVRGMGGGDVNLGAQRMYDQMKMLEAGGKV